MDDVAAAPSGAQAARERGPHDVRATRQALDMVAAIRGDLPPARTVRGLA
jgi:dihydropteroate synthase